MDNWKLALTIISIEDRLSRIEKQLGIERVPENITAEQVKELRVKLITSLNMVIVVYMKLTWLSRRLMETKKKQKHFLKQMGTSKYEMVRSNII